MEFYDFVKACDATLGRKADICELPMYHRAWRQFNVIGAFTANFPQK
jgi:hypothetical protein